MDIITTGAQAILDLLLLDAEARSPILDIAPVDIWPAVGSAEDTQCRVMSVGSGRSSRWTGERSRLWRVRS